MYFGVPIILGGCLLGELLFRGIIYDLNSAILYLYYYIYFLAFIIVSVTVGIPTTYEDSNTTFMVITMICCYILYGPEYMGEKEMNNEVTE